MTIYCWQFVIVDCQYPVKSCHQRIVWWHSEEIIMSANIHHSGLSFWDKNEIFLYKCKKYPNFNMTIVYRYNTIVMQ